MNVGATSETDYGLYFQWGDTQGYTADQVGTGEGKKAFKWTDYKYSDNGSSSVMTKYNETDGKTVLDLEDDAAAANWGGSWHMPTDAQLQELLNSNNCTRNNTRVNGIRGWMFTSVKNNNTLFLPQAGYMTDGRTNVGEACALWGSFRRSDSKSATDLYGDIMYIDKSYNYRYKGFSIRGVVG